MTAIHLLERSDNVRKTDRLKNEWDSGFWDVTEEKAQKLVGALLYLHRSKHQPAHFGGRILSYRTAPAGPFSGRIVFTLRATADCKDVKTNLKGWTNDHKIIWDAA
ncbi:MAG: hypothetical protein ACT4PS_02590 [Betaproteobacteria bacterium]